MSPKANSRFLLCTATTDAAGKLFLSERVPFRFQAFADNRSHSTEIGDTLFSLAGRYFAPLPRAAGFWWAIGDFQPDPIIDPTLLLDRGRVIVIPSIRTLQEVILNEDRREDFTP